MLRKNQPVRKTQRRSDALVRRTKELDKAQAQYEAVKHSNLPAEKKQEQILIWGNKMKCATEEVAILKTRTGK